MQAHAISHLNRIEAAGFKTDPAINTLLDVYRNSTNINTIMHFLSYLREKNLENDLTFRAILFKPLFYWFTIYDNRLSNVVTAYLLLQEAQLTQHEEIVRKVFERPQDSEERAKIYCKTFLLLKSKNLHEDDDIRKMILRQIPDHSLESEAQSTLDAYSILIENKLVDDSLKNDLDQDIRLTILNALSIHRVEQANAIVQAFSILKKVNLDNDPSARAIILAWPFVYKKEKAEAMAEAVTILKQKELDQVPEICSAVVREKMYSAPQTARNFTENSHHTLFSGKQKGPTEFKNLLFEFKKDMDIETKDERTLFMVVGKKYTADMLSVFLYDRTEEELNLIHSNLKMIQGKEPKEMSAQMFQTLVDHANPYRVSSNKI